MIPCPAPGARPHCLQIFWETEVGTLAQYVTVSVIAAALILDDNLEQYQDIEDFLVEHFISVAGIEVCNALDIR